MFQFAATNLVQTDVNIAPAERPYSDHAALAASSALVFPAYNHLRLGTDWSQLNNFLEDVNKPLIVLGLGAQSPKIGGEMETILALKADPSVQRMVDIFVKERSSSL